VEHPYHGLVQLIALANGNKVGSGVGGRQSAAYLENVGASKVAACSQLLQSIRRCGPPFVASLADAYVALLDSYIELAMAPTEQFLTGGRHRTKEIPLSAVSMGSRGIPSLDRCLGTSKRRLYACQPCVLTRPPILRPAGDYGEGKEDPIGSERIEGFHPTFSITETGLHRPKIIACLGTAGGRFKQLVKGEDDIRQDAIMQQIFSTVNRIFRAAAKHCFDSALQIATYTVVPLSPASGVLEWVVRTKPVLIATRVEDVSGNLTKCAFLIAATQGKYSAIGKLLTGRQGLNRCTLEVLSGRVVELTLPHSLSTCATQPQATSIR